MNVPIAAIIGMIKEATIHTAAMVKAGAAIHTAAMIKAGAAIHTAAMVKAGAAIHTAAMVKAGAAMHTAAMVKAGAAIHTAAMVKIGAAMLTDAETMEEVMTTAAIVDTGSALTGKNVTTPITNIEDTGMSTMAIGDPGTNGIDTPKPIRTFTGTETTIAKVPI